MADERTLKLASTAVDAARLEAFVVYQRELLRLLAAAPEQPWPGHFAFAHGRALAACGLTPEAHSRLRPLVMDFCGRRVAFQALCQRRAEALAELEAARTSGSAPGERALAVLQRCDSELPRLRALDGFIERHGQAALDVLMSREDELVTLHRELARVEGAGHVHVG